VASSPILARTAQAWSGSSLPSTRTLAGVGPQAASRKHPQQRRSLPRHRLGPEHDQLRPAGTSDMSTPVFERLAFPEAAGTEPRSASSAAALHLLPLGPRQFTCEA